VYVLFLENNVIDKYKMTKNRTIETNDETTCIFLVLFSLLCVPPSFASSPRLASVVVVATSIRLFADITTIHCLFTQPCRLQHAAASSAVRVIRHRELDHAVLASRATNAKSPYRLLYSSLLVIASFVMVRTMVRWCLQ